MEPLTLDAEQAAALLRGTHGIEARSMTPLGSELASAFRVDTEDGPLAVKLQRASPTELAVCAWRAEVIDRMSALGHPVPRAVQSLAGSRGGIAEFEGAPVFVLATRWADALPYSSAPRLSPDFGSELGRAAAAMQADLALLPEPESDLSHTWAAHTAAAVIEAHLAGVADPAARRVGETALEIHRRRIAPIEHELPRGLVHQDLHDDNVLVDAGGRIAAIIDFDDMLVGWRVAEPAVAAAYYARRSPDPIFGLDAVAQGWESVQPFTDAERSAYAPVASVRLALNTVVWAARAADPDRRAYALSRSRGSIPAFEALTATL